MQRKSKKIKKRKRKKIKVPETTPEPLRLTAFVFQKQISENFIKFKILVVCCYMMSMQYSAH